MFIRGSPATGGILGLSTLALACRALSSSVSPIKYWALRYTYVDGMLDKRTPYRQAHLEGLERESSPQSVLCWELSLHAGMAHEGKCSLGGAFNEPCDGAVVLFDYKQCTKAEVEEFARSDPYVVNGLVPEWTVSEYVAVVGSLKPQRPL